MRTTVFGLAAIPALGALVLGCGGAVSLAKPEERDSGSPVAQVDAAPPGADASVAPDSPDEADVVVLPDARDDVAPNPPEAGPPGCSMQLDPTFGVGGISTFVEPPYSQAASIAFEPGGAILAALGDPTYSRGVAAGRFDARGAIDPTYGKGGFAPLDGPGTDPGYEIPGRMAVQPDGKSLVVAWNANTPALARFHPDGTLDTGFGSGGNGPGGGYALPTTPFPNWWVDAALFGDGSIVVGGSADFWNSGCCTLLLAKYDKDGLGDPSFGTGGQVSLTSLGSVRRILAQPDGSFLVGGDATPAASSGESVRPLLERYTAAGALDVTFGSGGTAAAPMTGGGALVVGMAVQSTGAILLALAMAGSPNDDFLLLRYTPAGQLDTSFGDAGMARTDFFGARDYAMGLSLLPDDTLLVAGTVTEPADAGNVIDFGVARYTANGQPDTTFAPAGKLVTRFPQGGVEELDAQGLQPDGKLVVAGYGRRFTDAGDEHILTLARYACR